MSARSVGIGAEGVANKWSLPGWRGDWDKQVLSRCIAERMRLVEEENARFSSAGHEVWSLIEAIRDDDSEDAHVPDHVMLSASWQGRGTREATS